MALSTGHHLLHELDPGDQRLMNQPVFPHLPASTTANTVKTLKLTQVEHACSFALAWWKLLVACLLVLSCHVLSATLTTPMGTSRNSDLSATLSHFVFIEFRKAGHQGSCRKCEIHSRSVIATSQSDEIHAGFPFPGRYKL